MPDHVSGQTKLQVAFGVFSEGTTVYKLWGKKAL